MNLLFLVLWVFALPLPQLRPMASSISAVWACVMVVCKMFYQLKVIKPLDYSSNCTAVGSLWVVESKVCCLGAETKQNKTSSCLESEVLLKFHSQGLQSSNSSEMRENMMELLRRSILYVEPVDPVYWCGALRKCEGSILPCLQVRTCYKLFC